MPSSNDTLRSAQQRVMLMFMDTIRSFGRRPAIGRASAPRPKRSAKQPKFLFATERGCSVRQGVQKAGIPR